MHWYLMLVLCLAGCHAGSHPEECGKMQRLKVKTQWTQAFNHADDREALGQHIWTLIFEKHPEWRMEYFSHVRGNNTLSPEFRAHAARINGAFDLSVNLLMFGPLFGAHMAHLGHLHHQLHIPKENFEVFRHAIMKAVYQRVGRCFDYDAWNLCSKVITNAIEHGIEYSEDKHWGYSIFNGPATWNLVAPASRGSRQSPVDIHPADAEYDAALNDPALHWAYTPANAQTLSNNGHSVVVSYDSAGSSLAGGPLADEYQLAQFHLHWGLTSHSGSEHRVDGHMFAAELHMVHWNSAKYGSFGEAADKSDGLSVLGFFIQEGGEENAALKPITDLLQQVTHKGDSVPIDGGLDPVSIMPANTSKYWTYLGSLTTPPLYESVTWIVFHDPITVSGDQLESLRALMQSSADEPEVHDEFHGHICENYRPPQPLHGRAIRASFH